MILLAIAVLQGAGSLGNVLPHDERLRFAFVAQQRIGRPRITGASATPTAFSTTALHDIVAHCGGRGIGIARNGASVISVEADSTTRNLDVARCVRASTSLRFSVGVRETGFASVAFDQEPFRQLWDS